MAQRRLLVAAAVAAAAFPSASLLPIRSAYAVDARAEAAAKDAIKKTASDFAAGDYATAAARLDKALAGCSGKKCAPGTKAFVLRDLGTMQFKMGDKDAAANSFGQALALDHDIELSSKYDAPDVRAAWNHAKSLAATTPGAPPPEQPIGGDFSHTPAAEQKIRTPLPIYVEPQEGTSVARVVVKYKPAASSGDPKHPFTVPIRDEISGEPPSLPDKPPPHTCAPGDSGESDRGGDSAEGSSGSPGRYARLWVGLAGVVEFFPMPSANDACVLSTGPTPPPGFPANSSNLYCVDSQSGADFPPRTATGAAINNQLRAMPGSGGKSSGGIQPGDIRLLLSLDYALSQNFLVGGRVGYTFNSYPGSAASQDGRAAGFKVHGEARATYLLGSSPLDHVGLAWMGSGGLGFGEFDGHVGSVVTHPTTAGQQAINVDIWDTDGPFFFFIAAGARYQFSPRIAGTAAFRINVAVGGNGVVSTLGLPEVGVQYGF